MKKAFFKFILVISCVVLMCVLPTYAKAEDSKRTVSVAFVPQDKNFEINEDGTYSGYSYEYIMKIAQYANWNIEFVMPESQDIDQALMEMMQRAEKGEVDLLASVLYQEQMAQQFQYPSSNYGNVYTTLVASPYNEKINKTNLLLQEHITIGVIKKSKTRIAELKNFLATNDVKYTLIEYETYQEVLQAMEDKVVDVSLNVSLSTPANFAIVAQFSNRPYYFVTQKGRTDITDEMDEAMQKISYTLPQYMTDLYNKYFVEYEEILTLFEEECEFIRQNPTIKVLIPYNLPPIQHYETDVKLHGIYISFMKYLKESTGLEYEIDNYETAKEKYGEKPWKHYDLILGLEQDEMAAIEYDMIYSIPFLKSSTVMFYNKKVDIKNLSNLRAAKSASGANIYNESTKEVEYENIYECLKAVNKGEADFGYGADIIVDYAIDDANYKNLIVAPSAKKGKDFVVAYNSAAQPELISIVNKVLRTIDSKQINAFVTDELYKHSESVLTDYFKKNPAMLGVMIGVLTLGVLTLLIMGLSLKKSSKKNMELIKENNAKSDFLSDMSHEMRTPMNAILGITNIAMDEINSPDAVRDYLVKIKYSGTYLLGLINDILDMAKIESGSFSLNKVQCNTSQLYDNIENVIVPLAKEKNIEFVFNRPQISRYLLVDPLRFNQIFFNILTNSIKFTEKGGKVTFSVTNSTIKDGIISSDFIITDTGIGMSKSFQKKMFEPFAQENDFSSKDYQRGTGLGLPIIKKTVDMLGGTITVDSVKNQGTTFKIRISSELVQDDEVLDEKEQTKTIEYLSGKKVLIVEDHPLNVEIAKKLLLKKGLAVESAENGQVAVDMIKNAGRCNFDLILMDIRMPVMDGLTATKIIRGLNMPNAKQVPIIAMSANAFDDDIKKSLQAGINEHLAKPIDPQLLYTTIATFLQ